MTKVYSKNIWQYELNSNITIDFEYGYEPGDAEITYYPDGSGYPGSSSEVTIHHAWIELKNKNNKLIEVDILPYINIMEELALADIIYEIIHDHEEN